MSFHKTFFQDCLRVLVSLFFIGLLVYFFRDKWKDSIGLLKQINLPLFAFVFFLFFLTNVVVSVRLKKVLEIQRIVIGFSKLFYYTLVGLFFNLFLPSSLGGDVVKVYYLSKFSGSKLHSISAVIVDRILGLCAVILVAVAALPFFMKSFSDPKLVSTVLLFAGIFFTGCLLVFSRRVAKQFKFLVHWIPSESIREKARSFYQTILQFRGQFPKLTYGIFLSLVVQVITIYMGFLVSKSIGMNVPFVIFILILPVSGIISMVPSLGGLGPREASIAYFLTPYSSPASAVAFALAYDILVYGAGLFCGILFMVFGRKMGISKAALHDQ